MEENYKKKYEIMKDNAETLAKRIDKATKNAKEKIKQYESYINDLKNGEFSKETIRKERNELIFRIREQEDLLDILEGRNV